MKKSLLHLHIFFSFSFSHGTSQRFSCLPLALVPTADDIKAHVARLVCTLLPVHCPVSQLVNAVGGGGGHGAGCGGQGVLDVVASGQMKRVERTFIPLSGTHWKAELFLRPARAQL